MFCPMPVLRSKWKAFSVFALKLVRRRVAKTMFWQPAIGDYGLQVMDDSGCVSTRRLSLS